MKELIGITGASGEIGRRVAERLAGLGVRQRLIVRDPSHAPDLPGSYVTRLTDYGDAASVRAAVEGVGTLLLVSAKEHIDRLSQHLTAVDAAVDAGVERIVYTSFLGAAPDAIFTFGRQHYATEERIKSKGVAFTFLRDSLYLDFIPWIAGADGAIRGPGGSGRFAPIARDDVADTAVEVLTSNGSHDGDCYDMTGPETLSFQGAADELSRVSGREVVYIDETLEEAWASRRPIGAPDWEIEGWITSYLAIAQGELDVVSDTVPRLTGHPAQSLPEFLGAHPECYAHLVAGNRASATSEN
ncbi:MAG: SDR family oxidoreductase [Actinomycetota bacterium]